MFVIETAESIVRMIPEKLPELKIIIVDCDMFERVRVLNVNDPIVSENLDIVDENFNSNLLLSYELFYTPDNVAYNRNCYQKYYLRLLLI